MFDHRTRLAVGALPEASPPVFRGCGHRCQTGTAAFTLLELLVVAGIIGVLAALLSTAFNNAKAKTQRDPVFGFDVATECPNVPSEILIPRNAWADKAAYDATARKLAGLFNKNFETYAAGATAEVKAAAPVA